MATTVRLNVIEDVRIAAPCPMRWEDMSRRGGDDDTVRHCQACDLNVYNFSNMHDDQIAPTLRDVEGRLCAAYFRRADGTIITKNCPVGLRAVRARMVRTASRIAAAIGVVLTGGVLFAKRDQDGVRLRHTQPFSAVCERLSASTPPRQMIVGLVCPPNFVRTAPAGAGIEEHSGDDCP